MALIHEFAVDVPREVVRRVQSVQEKLLATATSRSLSPDVYNITASTEGDAYADLVEATWTPPLGIYGSGFWAEGEVPTPVFFVLGHERDDSVTFIPDVRELPSATALLHDRLERVPSGFGAVRIPPVMPQGAVGPGDVVTCYQQTGTLGIPVATRSGARGITTAGHVVTKAGDEVFCDAGKVGSVEALDMPAAHSPNEIVADCAVIAMDAAMEDEPTNLGPLATARPFQPVTVLTAARSEGVVRGMAPLWMFRPDIGAWGEVCITDRAVSRGGDSGAPCVNEAGEVIGHIVAGDEYATSIIQDANYQLRQMGVKARLV